MATLTVVNPRIVKAPNGVEIDDSKLITSGQSWKAGQFLTLSSGLLVACGTDEASVRYLALEDVTDPGNSTTPAKVVVLTSDMVLEIHELDGALVAADIGKKYAINVTSNKCTLDVADTGTAAKNFLLLEELGPDYNELEDASGDVKARCRVKIIQSALEA